MNTDQTINNNLEINTDQTMKTKENGWDVYPRPQLQRASFLNLNGSWDFCVTEKERLAEEKFWEVIVPYPVESELSGIGRHFKKGSMLIYRKKFSLSPEFQGGRVLLHCGGIDQVASLFVNRREAGSFITQVDGPINVDITEFLTEGENEIVFQVTDDLSPAIPYGKQKEERGGMWYTPVSGIWQTVWLEHVPEHYIRDLKITATDDEVTIEVLGDGVEEGTILCENERYQYKEGKLTIRPEKPKVWTPETPFLYYFAVKSGEDEVLSYFALRRVDIRDVNGIRRICLNGKPFFFHGLLDQGYYSEGIYTPSSPKAYKNDILTAKHLGFNTLRKHLKVEPEEFYFQCDRLGMFVFQDMVNNGTVHFLTDTVLPNIGIMKPNDHFSHPDPLERRNFLHAMESTVKRLYNHPSICTWTIFNEGWGQFESSKAYERLKQLDPVRIVDSASGWFQVGKSDVDSRHVYFRPFRMPRLQGKPVILSEFGGYSLKIKEHSYTGGKNHGYRRYRDQESLEAGVRKLYEEEIIPAIESGLCGCIYTQLADVEDETNGILTCDRAVVKVREEVLIPIAESIGRAMGHT